MISSLSDSVSPSSDLRPVPSEEFARRYALKLNRVWQDWFDRGSLIEGGAGEFTQPVDPATLLEEQPEMIWPGFMLPDSLPILGNGYGDWLCLRAATDDTVSEIVHWYHGGGDWMPWGKTPAEAIAFDTLRQSLPGRRVGHSIRPSDGNTEPESPFDSQRDLTDWAADHLPRPIASRLDPKENSRDAIWDRCVDNEVAAVAMLSERALTVLDGHLRQRLRADIARKLHLAWEPDVVSWMFDERLVPRERRAALVHLLRMDVYELDQQDWTTARACCMEVLRRRTDLGWCWDLLGWSAERRGQTKEAIECYRAALNASSFSDQSIRFRTHWFPESFGKFAAYRLWMLRDSMPEAMRSHPLVQTYWAGEPQTLRMRVFDYWTNQADQHAQRGAAALEYDALYRAGWDLGCDDLPAYGPLLMRMSRAASQAGQHARAAIAQTHAECLMHRIGR